MVSRSVCVCVCVCVCACVCVRVRRELWTCELLSSSPSLRDPAKQPSLPAAATRHLRPEAAATRGKAIALSSSDSCAWTSRRGMQAAREVHCSGNTAHPTDTNILKQRTSLSCQRAAVVTRLQIRPSIRAFCAPFFLHVFVWTHCSHGLKLTRHS